MTASQTLVEYLRVRGILNPMIVDSWKSFSGIYHIEVVCVGENIPTEYCLFEDNGKYVVID